MNMFSRISIVTLSFLALNAATQTPTNKKLAVKSFEDLALGKQPLNVLAELVAKDTPLVAKFYMPGCGPCKGTEEGFERMAKKYQGQAEFVIIDTTRFDLAKSYAIRTVPTFIIFHKNKKVAQFKRDGIKKEGFEEAIEKELKKLGVTGAQEKA